MKLISCYIENYGKLSKKSFNFDSGLNTILEDNGYGKTTLASFIKSMFYGLKSTTKRSVKENERKKFTPWQGGAFGGNLVFETNNKTYRIERFFGAKESEDTFSLIDMKTGKPSKDYSKDIGEEIFELDSESYERCTFYPQSIFTSQKEQDKNLTDSLSKKLNNIIQGTDSKDSLETAIALLEKRNSQIKNRQNNGILPEIEQKIEDFENKEKVIRGKKEVVDKLESDNLVHTEKIQELSSKLSEVKDKITDYSEIIKKESDIKANKKVKDEYERILGETNEKLNYYNKVLSGNQVSGKDIALASEKQKEIEKLSQKQEFINSSLESDKKKELMLYFKNSPPSDEEIAEAEKTIKNNQSKHSLNNESNIKSQKSLKTIIILMAVASILFLFATILGAINKTKIWYLYLIAASLLLIALIINIVKYVKLKGEMLSNVSESKIKLIEMFEPNAESQEKALEKIKFNLFELNKIIESEQQNLSQIDNIRQEIALKTKELNQFMSLFNFESGLSTNQKLNLLNEILNTMPKLLLSKNEYLEKINNLPKSDEKNENASQIDIHSLQDAEEKLQKEIDSEKTQKEHNNAEIKHLNEELDSLESIHEQLEILNEVKQKLVKEIKLIDKTKKFLNIASDELSSKYLSPLKDNLDKYLAKFIGVDSKKLNIDTELNVTIDEGKSYDLDYLSKGYQAVVELCIRMALTDVLFKNEKPFVILDDPFVNMDEAKIAKAVELIKNLSHEKQIIYLTCHKSRI